MARNSASSMSCRDHLLGGRQVVVADGLAELAHDLVLGHGLVLRGWAMRVNQPRQAGGWLRRRRRRSAVSAASSASASQVGGDPGGPLQHPA